ncbi:nicotinate-nucleotide adenylyltransferase [Weissella coleopterorum]|uniref:Probable nicotinate-nucleotide adenylyltransferase n=1 Tax=Weissella coleopterorum TaxID=2714949 RepID=A0A6G8B1B3_9LACO|nr:nicotinate-nucleotide adenylyltransferase [Weissella coleopterorum]QIL51005.1 nicotinate-nucleotide adenylyltransferase [Weissella coleopterorum]
MIKTVHTLAPETQVATEIDQERHRVGIIGGTFNPPHLGHLVIAEQVASNLDLEQVYFMPNAQPPHVDFKDAIDALDRVEMVRAAIYGNRHFALELAEVNRGGVSYSYDTMRYLTELHPNYDYYFIIGGDEVAYLKTWYKIGALSQMVQFVGVNRPGQETPKTDYPVQFVNVSNLDISSTKIRERIQKQQSVRYLLPDLVAAYIVEKGLYQDE